MWQVNLEHPEETRGGITVFVADANNDNDAEAKALEILAGKNPGVNLAEGFKVTLVRKVAYALVPDPDEVMFGNHA